LNLLKAVSDRLRGMNDQYIDRIVQQEKLALVGQMASSIIHDFKSPMTVIRAAAEMIELKDGDDYIQKNSQAIMRNVDRITDMANDLLCFAMGKVQLHLQYVDPHAWTENIRELLAPVLENRRVELRREVLTAEPLWLDPNKMMRVIYNLSMNAVEAMFKEGVLTVRLAKNGEETQIDLADTGAGIPEPIRDRLFGTFVTYGKRNGTGLGTAIAKKIVEEHGGKISFTTSTGKGTTFHIRLPSGPAPAAGRAV
jgi:signal transduction histidine kinase